MVSHHLHVCHNSYSKEFMMTSKYIVDSFTKSRGLCLCPEKCALLTSSRKPASASGITIGDTCLPIEHSVKFLGRWWDSSPSSKTSVSERIKKARAAFFSHGQLGAFHGLLNPLSSRSIGESCILPDLCMAQNHGC